MADKRTAFKASAQSTQKKKKRTQQETREQQKSSESTSSNWLAPERLLGTQPPEMDETVDRRLSALPAHSTRQTLENRSRTTAKKRSSADRTRRTSESHSSRRRQNERALSKASRRKKIFVRSAAIHSSTIPEAGISSAWGSATIRSSRLCRMWKIMPTAQTAVWARSVRVMIRILRHTPV